MRKLSLLFTLSLLVVAFAASTVFGARFKHEYNRRVIDPKVYKGTFYSLPDESAPSTNGARGERVPTNSLSSASPSASPGIAVGTTWYEYYSNGSTKRSAQNNTTGGTTRVYFAWTDAADSTEALSGDRGYGYRVFDLTGCTFPQASPTHIQGSGVRAGFIVQDVTPDGKANVGGHETSGLTQPHFYWEQIAGNAFFNTFSRIPDAVIATGTPTETSFIWPALAYQVNGADTVTHVVAAENAPGAGDPQSLKYFRKVGRQAAGTWTLGKQIDTTFLISYDVTAQRGGNKMAFCWTANLPDAGGHDSTSSNSGLQFVQLDNNLFCQTSNDKGVTFNPRVNVTKYVDGVDGHRAYANLSALILGGGNLVCAFEGRFWPSDANTGGNAGLLRNRIFFWNESFAPGVIRTAHNAEWDQTDCNGGAFNLNATKMNVAECAGRVYIFFVQFNDIPAGIGNDCHVRAASDPVGSANGEIYMVVSEDAGVTWDQGDNITESRTPACDTVGGVGGPCFADQYPTVAPFGIAVDCPSGATLTAGAGTLTGRTHPNSSYMDVEYTQDQDPGGAIRPEGTWKEATIAWMRVPCVSAVPNPILQLSYSSIGFPAFTKNGVQKDSVLTLENSGNVALNFTSITDFETTGPAGWLTLIGFPASIPSGFANTATGTVRLNAGGIVNAPGTKTVLTGGVVFVSNAPTTPDTLPILFTVADTVIPPKFDTIFVRGAGNPKLALVVSTNGNYGNQGAGNVNMDFADFGDCDTLDNVYLYDGSAVIGWVNGADTIMNWTIFSDSWLESETALRPFAGLSLPAPPSLLSRFRDCPNFEYFRTGRFVTFDSSIALEKSWYAPKTTSPSDTCFIIQCLKVWSLTGAKSNLTIGEAIDWDIPADSGADNSSAISLGQEIWQRGVEADTTQGTLVDCQADTTRFGGIKFLFCYRNATQVTNAAFGAYTAENDTLVIPQGGFVAEELYSNMRQPGYAASDSVEDLHMVMTFSDTVDLAATDTLRYYIVLATIRNGTQANLQTQFARGLAWFNNKTVANIPPDSCAAVSTSCCVGTRGNVNGAGGVTVADLTFLVNFLFNAGPVPPCTDEANVNGAGGITVADLTFLVNFLFNAGPNPPACP